MFKTYKSALRNKDQIKYIYISDTKIYFLPRGDFYLGVVWLIVLTREDKLYGFQKLV